jgi:hypothetical protein
MTELLLALQLLSSPTTSWPTFSATIFEFSGGWSGGAAWTASISEAGELSMACGESTRRRVLSEPERRNLVATFSSNDVLRLSGQYGRGVIDGLNRSVEIRVASERARFSLGWLGTGAVAPAAVADARRALRIYVAIRELEPTCYPEGDRVRDRAFLAEP